MLSGKPEEDKLHQPQSTIINELPLCIWYYIIITKSVSLPEPRAASAAGKGLQQTFWLWPDDQFKYGTFHPSSGEIDFAEFYSNYRIFKIKKIAA